MTTPIAHGWNVRQGYSFVVPGRVLCHLMYATRNCQSGYAGFDGTYANDCEEYKADSERCFQAYIEWLCGKTTGASILVMETGGRPITTGSDGIYDEQFCAGMENLGHTITLTGVEQNFGTSPAYDPFDFDVVCAGESSWTGAGVMADWPDTGTHSLRVQYFIDNGGHLLCNGTTTFLQFIDSGSVLEPYGIYNPGNLHTSHSGETEAYRIPMTDSIFAADEELLMVFGSSNRIGITTSDKGGTVGGVRCDYHTSDEYVVGWWTA